VNGKGMAEGFGVRGMFMLRLGGCCMSWYNGKNGWAG
jgi:hypothetical protein